MSSAVIQRVADKANPYFPAGQVSDVNVTVGTETSHARNVALIARGPDQKPVSAPVVIEAFLSDAATGLGLCASAPSGGWAIGTNGALLSLTANKHAKVVFKSDGTADITITEATAKDFYLVLIIGNKTKITKVSFAG